VTLIREVDRKEVLCLFSLVPLQDTYIGMYIKVHYSYIAMYIKYMQP
jgi:hypothetical protein